MRLLLSLVFVVAFSSLAQAQYGMLSHANQQANRGSMFHAQAYPARFEAVGVGQTRAQVRASWSRSSSPIHRMAAIRPMRCVRRNGQLYCTSRFNR